MSNSPSNALRANDGSPGRLWLKLMTTEEEEVFLPTPKTGKKSISCSGVAAARSRTVAICSGLDTAGEQFAGSKSPSTPPRVRQANLAFVECKVFHHFTDERCMEHPGAEPDLERFCSPDVSGPSRCSRQNATTFGRRCFSHRPNASVAVTIARPHESRRLTTTNTDAIVQHITSPLVTSAHIDVTSQPIEVAYASPKHFVFPSKRQLYWMDANRWVRQRIKESKVTSVSELASISCSINNIGEPVNASIRAKRKRTELIRLTIIHAFRRLRFSTKTLH